MAGPLPTVHVLYDGYSRMENETMRANCSCVLVREGTANYIVDTMTPWDTDRVKQGQYQFVRVQTKYRLKSFFLILKFFK